MSGHSFLGSLKFDIPVGLILTALFYLCIRPIARLLPYPHREACHAVCPVVSLPSFRSILVAAISVLLGAWTHIIWDGFTHANGWCVKAFSSTTPAMFMLGSYKVTIWHILQHGSTVFGLACLLYAYHRYAYGRRFLKERAMLAPKASVLVWLALLIPPAVFAVNLNLDTLNGPMSFSRIEEFCSHSAVAYVCLFVPLASTAGVLISLLEYFFLAPAKKDSIASAFVKERANPMPSSTVSVASAAAISGSIPTPVAASVPPFSGSVSGEAIAATSDTIVRS